MKTSTKKVLSLVLALGFIISTIGIASAQWGGGYGPHHGRGGGGPGYHQGYGPGGPGYGQGYGPGGQGYEGYEGDALSAEQRASIDKLYNEHRDKVGPMFREMDNKNADLYEEMYKDTPNESKINSLSKEIGELQGKINAERVKMRTELEKEGISPRRGFYRGAHRGHGGYGPCWR